MKKYFKNASYALKLGVLSYLFLVALFVIDNLIKSRSVGMFLSPLLWILVFLGLGPLFHFLASILILIFTLFRERKEKAGKKIKIILMNLLLLFVVDLFLILVLIAYSVLNQGICFVLHSSSDVCVLMLAI